MLPDKFPVAVDAVRTQAHASAWQLLTIGAVANHDDASIKSIIDSLGGPEWDKLTLEKQQANENIIRKAYQEELEAHLAVLPKYLYEIEQIPKPHSALLANLDFEPDETFNGQPAQYVPQAGQEMERDQAARKNLGQKKYDIYKQDLEHVVKARGAAEKSKFPELSKDIEEVFKGKKECPVCFKTLCSGAISRHYQQVHRKDACYAIYCPKCNYVEWRGDSTIDNHLRTQHNLVLNENKTEEATGKTKGDTKSKTKNEAKGKAKIKIKFTKPVSSEGHGREVEQAEQAEKFQGGDGGDAKGNEMVDEEMADMEMMVEDTAGESMFVDNTLDEDMDDVYS